MEDFGKFKRLLQTRVQDWRSMIEHPKLFIDKHFTDARIEIDCTIELALQKLYKDTLTQKLPVQNDVIKKVPSPGLLS